MGSIPSAPPDHPDRDVGRMRVVVTGDLDRHNGPRLLASLAQCLGTATILEIDLGLIDFIDSDGLLCLIDTWTARADDQTVVVCEASPPVRRLLQRTGTAGILGLDSHLS